MCTISLERPNFLKFLALGGRHGTSCRKFNFIQPQIRCEQVWAGERPGKRTTLDTMIMVILLSLSMSVGSQLSQTENYIAHASTHRKSCTQKPGITKPSRPLHRSSMISNQFESCRRKVRRHCRNCVRIVTFLETAQSTRK